MLRLVACLVVGTVSSEITNRLADRAHVIVHKRLVSSYRDPHGADILVKGRPFTVSYVVSNLGAECVTQMRRRREGGSAFPPLAPRYPPPSSLPAAHRGPRMLNPPPPPLSPLPPLPPQNRL